MPFRRSKERAISTRHPKRPVIDKFVMENLGLTLPKSTDKDRPSKIISVYEPLVKQYERMLNEPKYMTAVAQLKEQYPEAESISNVKALDLMLWQAR